MKLNFSVQNHPFKLLLYLEWVLLAIAILAEVLPNSLLRTSGSPFLNLIALVGFGLMGLWLPTTSHLHQLAYICTEIMLFLTMTLAGGAKLASLINVVIILVMRGCVILSQRGRFILTGLAFALFQIAQIKRFHEIFLPTFPLLQEALRQLQLGSSVIFLLCLIFVLFLIDAALAARQSQAELALAHAKLRQYALRVEDRAKLEERNRIARDIHDSLGHSLTALNIQLETALKLWELNPSKAFDFLAEAKRLGSTALQDVRQSVTMMRADPLEGKSLTELIATLCMEFQQSTGITPHCQIQVLPQPLSEEIQITVYRLVQESLTNIAKHARTDSSTLKVEIDLNFNTENLHLSIKDNGNGFQLKQNQTGFGLQGMRERVSAIQGKLRIQSDIGQGCQIEVDLPLARRVL